MSDTIDLTGDDTVPQLPKETIEPVIIDVSKDDVPAPIQIRPHRPMYRRRRPSHRAARMSVPYTRSTPSEEPEASDSSAESKQGSLVDKNKYMLH